MVTVMVVSLGGLVVVAGDAGLVERVVGRDSRVVDSGTRSVGQRGPVGRLIAASTKCWDGARLCCQSGGVSVSTD